MSERPDSTVRPAPLGVAPTQHVDVPAPEKPVILWFGEIGMGDTRLVGGKAASLGEMYQQLVPKGVRIPNGFATSTGDVFGMAFGNAQNPFHIDNECCCDGMAITKRELGTFSPAQYVFGLVDFPALRYRLNEFH